jgi:hypothetical protein
MRTMVARYAVNTSKTLEMILWLATERPGIDVYHVVKAAFYADKHHLNEHGRPIAGDDYIADQYGPLGDVIYGLLKGDPLERLALDGNGELPFTVENRFQVRAHRSPNLRRLAESEIRALRIGLNFVADKTFAELVDISHQEAAYVAAEGGRMQYENLLEPADPERAAHLAETAPSAAL